ncbi:acyl-CoA dehydrogenase family protein [Sphingopyxis sp.]|uniref:acyl-CoA dehydrogenase family protein n=1 Tax=Sphingopyxis sp. TaxID=1908224 RepID=UPI0025EB13D2|nr:acyl-CoA dehydrogenase family protein [Sphingopyxis sp.]MBK6411606.1 acyl-CoA dehydrogenase family protein [Sphingopyxis sp.]
MLDTADRPLYDTELDIFRDQVRRLLARDIVPHLDSFEDEGIVPRSIWRTFGDAGMLCPSVPEQYGGMGLDFRYNAVVNEEISYAASNLTFPLQSDIIAEYLTSYGTEEQKQAWLPQMARGEAIAAIAMTEPGTGSDLQSIRTSARREGDHYVLRGQKTFISHGQHCDFVIVAASTNSEGGAKGISLLIVEATREGFKRGRNLDKIGQKSSDTSELFFEDVRVPITNLLGEENRGFACLMSQLPQERLSVSIGVQANAQRAFDITVDYVKQRKAFGKTVFDLQNTRFALADLRTKLQVGWAHIDWALSRHLQGKLTSAEASAAKLWHTETQWEVMDACLQLHGGHGYMNEMPIARMWRDARVTRIYGGTSEIMREIIGRSI